MRFFHVSDLHLGLKLINRDLRADQEHILSQISALAGEYHPDAVVIVGDIYDKSIPSAEAVEVFDHFISELTGMIPDASIMIISGNHDSAARINCFRSLLSRQNVHMIGLPPSGPQDYIEKVSLEDDDGIVNFYLLPFVKPSMVKEIVGVSEEGTNLSYEESLRRLIGRERLDPTQRNILVSHQFYLPVGKTGDEVERMDSEVKTVGNIDAVSAQILEAFDYAALGHIHKPMKVGSEYFRYCGTPLACSVSEAGQPKSLLMVDLGPKGDIKVRELPLSPLRQVRVLRGTLGEILAQRCEDYVTVILTDRVDLDILDMQDRLRSAFPNLLEIRREGVRQADYSRSYSEEERLDPFALCCSFLKDIDDEEKAILRDVIDSISFGGDR